MPCKSWAILRMLGAPCDDCWCSMIEVLYQLVLLYVRIKLIVMVIFCVWTFQPKSVLNLLFFFNFSNIFYELTPRFIKPWNYDSEHDLTVSMIWHKYYFIPLLRLIYIYWLIQFKNFLFINIKSSGFFYFLRIKQTWKSEIY